MTTALTAFVVAFVVGMAVTALMLRIAPMVGAVDQPDGYRKIHRVAIPRLGGIGAFCGFLAPIALLLCVAPDNPVLHSVIDHGRAFATVVAGALVALFMGTWDDIRPLRPRVKLLLQIGAAAIAMYGGHGIWRLSLPWIGEIQLGLWGLPLTLFWYLGCMNAINLLDGMDGLAGGVSLIVCITLMLVGQMMGNTSGMLLMGCLAGGILGFLVFNFNPARIFLGDSGSNTIGFLIAALAIMSSRKSETAVALLIPVIALGLPITDTGLAIVRRWSRGLPMSAPDRQHIHHLLLALGLSQRRAVLIIYSICIALCVGAVLSITADRELVLMVFGAMGIMVFVCVRILGAFRFTDLRTRFTRDWQCREASSHARVAVERCAHHLARCTSLDELWTHCGVALQALDIDEARLAIPGGDRPGFELTWRLPGGVSTASAPESWQVCLKVMAGPTRGPALLVASSVVDGNQFLLPGRLELLCRLRGLLNDQVPRLLAQRPTGAAPTQEAARASA
ncbi:MAG: undecaprenyl/decaprenyl-phosphate alpha-N-acetylglucosaminyl 1-phosphate transferase [Lentisphaerae bacterium]|nr:undecaprenyl/decaprenyl-phosphate alpha-N-acetylglucosaminyl 1-phosphate transferase [Lentisphaerota bacterium]